MHCYVVFELKLGEFKPEYAGQLNFYLSTVDAQIKTDEDKPTIGVLLCKTPNETVIEYALRGIDKPMGVAEFKLEKSLPEKLKTELPTVKELEDELGKEIEEIESPIKTKLDKMKNLLSNLNREEARQKQDSKINKKLFEKLIAPLYENISELLKPEIFPLFESNDIMIWTDGRGHESYADTELYLLKNEHLNEFKIQVQLNGFKKAGKDAFNISQEISIKLENYKYQINLGGFQPILLDEKLYHQFVDESEIAVISQKLMEKMIDDINEHIERISKKG